MLRAVVGAIIYRTFPATIRGNGLGMIRAVLGVVTSRPVAMSLDDHGDRGGALSRLWSTLIAVRVAG